MAKFIGNRCIPTPEGKWDKTKEYLGLSVVLDEKTGDSYTSKKAVPAGTELTNKDYWVMSGQYNAQMALIKQQLNAMQNIPEGGTTADAALENIRIGADGTEYATPGDAVRGQAEALSEEIDELNETLDSYTELTRNMVNIKNVEIGKAQNTSINAARASLFLKVVAGEKYTISFNDINNFEHVYWYQKERKDIISALSEGVVTNELTLTIVANATILCIQFNKTNIASSDFDNMKLQVEHGEYATEYIDYITMVDSVAREKPSYCDYDGSNDIAAFTNCVCIGDSLTAGTFNHNESGTTDFYVFDKYSFPRNLERLTNVKMKNLGHGGKTSAEWYDLEKNNDLSGYDMAILQLGVNDALKLNGWVNETKQAFKNIISKVKNENNGIKIFVSTIIPSVAYSGTAYDNVSKGIRSLITELNDDSVILIDLAKYGHTLEHAYNCGHLSAYGYYRLAQDYKNYISYYMANNKDKFRFIQFIGTSSTYSG
ncbi:SGNH/GDSL hydrolase family protein [Robinsoniella peoriensis]